MQGKTNIYSNRSGKSKSRNNNNNIKKQQHQQQQLKSPRMNKTPVKINYENLLTLTSFKNWKEAKT